MGSNISTEDYTSSEGYTTPSTMSAQSASFEIESKRKKPGVSILKEILRRIKLNEDLIKENNAILHAFLNSFIVEMKKDKLFNFVFKELYFTGSFYSDLRVSIPDEFDINLILKLPFKESDFEIIHQYQAPSFAKYRLRNYEAQRELHPLLVSTFFEEGFLIPGNVRQWLQSVIAKAMLTYKVPSTCERVSARTSGPANTILLRKRTGQIDIDLVPVISCTLDLPNLDGRVAQKVGNKLMTFLVPKPFSSGARQMPISKKEAVRLWRTHFPKAEEQIIHNLGCVKPVIKLLKLLRDEQDWKILASYYLKTVVMWMVIENSKQEYWKEDRIDEIFLEALKKLSSCVGQQKITYFFNKKHNLLEKMSDQHAVNIHGRLKHLINKIETNPQFLWSAFKMQPSYPNS